MTPSLTWRASNSAQLDLRYFVDRNRVSGDSGIPLVPLDGGFMPSAERGIIGDPLTRAISGDDSASIPNVPPSSRYNTPQDFGSALDQNLRVSYSQVLGDNFIFRDTLGFRRFDVETELRGNVTPDWLLDVGYGFTAASFLDYTTSRGAVLSGNTPRRSPRHTVTFSTSYLWPNGLAVMGAGQYISSQFLNDAETVEFNGYERLSLGVSYTSGRAQYALNLTNVTNTAYWQSSLGSRQLYPGEPFNVMATVRIRTN